MSITLLSTVISQRFISEQHNLHFDLHSCLLSFHARVEECHVSFHFPSLIFLRGCFVLGNSAKRKSIFYHFGRKCLSSLFPIPDIVLAWQFIRRHRLTRSLEREILWMTSAIFLPSFCFSQIGTIDTLERPLEAAFLPSRTFLQFSFSVSLDPCYLFCFLFSRLSKFQKRSNLQSLPEVL